MTVVRMSVRAVVETTLHESDLSPAAASAQRMREGAAAHKLRQAGAARMEKDYRAEVPLVCDYDAGSFTLHVTGRADGLFTRQDGTAVVEEIKLGAEDAPLVPAHRAQAAMYGHMLCEEQGLSGACIRVLYVDEHGLPLQTYEEDCTAEALAGTFSFLCEAAADWEKHSLERKARRDASLSGLKFPFEAYRAGQRLFAANVYVAIRDRKRLFAQAPTGIGKTMAALYPALVALGEGKCRRVLFLTARNTGRKSAMDAAALLQRAGARLLAVEIAAKDKVCRLPVRDCRPEVCPYAAGFYDRLPGALLEALRAEDGCFGREALSELAEKHRLCPFELSLALSALADVTVCDYNYVYDPFVSIEALMAGGTALLVDEAHQLAARVQDGRSAEVKEEELRSIRREAGRALGRKHPLYLALTGVIQALTTLAEQPDFAALFAPPEALSDAMEALLDAAGEALSKGAGQPAAQAFTLARTWQYAAGHFNERYAVLTAGEKKKAAVRLLLLCAAPDILERSKRAQGTVYFSATLAPFDAAQKMLGSADGDACLAVPSPFDPAQLRAEIAPIDIRYAAREKTAPLVAQAIEKHLRENAGNTLVFFPSYAYLSQIAALLPEDLPFLREERGMREDEKNALLGAFESQAGERAALFCVLGGAFSEGIDLAGDRLKNVIVVSTGLPQPDERVKAMQRYYDERGEDGFFLCMTLPGMVRVIQAAGRLIRTDTDTGTLLFIDSRYGQRHIRALMENTLIGQALYGSPDRA